jgi:hypothetical protein
MASGGAAAIPARGSPDLAGEEAIGCESSPATGLWPKMGQRGRLRIGPAARLLGGRWSSTPAKGAAPAVQQTAQGGCVGLCGAVRTLGRWW